MPTNPSHRAGRRVRDAILDLLSYPLAALLIAAWIVRGRHA